MGEIFGGIVVMGLFIAFIVWKGKNKTKANDPLQKIHEDQYWAEKDAQRTEVTSFDSDDDGGDD